MNARQIITDLRTRQARVRQKIYQPTRQVALNEAGVSIHLGGLSKVAALYGGVEIPYADIRNVVVGPVKEISIFAPRMGYSNPLSGARAGRFRTRGEHIFASYDGPENDILTLNLVQNNQSTFDTIVIQVDNAKQIEKQLKEIVK